jgi:hypothetical protein
VAAAAGSLAVALLKNWCCGDDEPAPEPSESEISESVGLEREADDLEQQAREWLMSREDADDGH